MPHSILKNSRSYASTASIPPVAQTREERNKETALYHAQLLQQRKDIETLILASTEALLELPSSVCANPARPSPSDAALFTSSLEPFQPSDYDALIEERNINEQCGYALCPRRNKKQDTTARYRILQGQGKGPDGLRFVPRQSLEKWCCDDCGKRALYVRVQLSEEPSWTRAKSSNPEIMLLRDQEDSSKSDSDLVDSILKLDMKEDDEDQFAEKMKALAIERGDCASDSRSRGLDRFDVREKSAVNGKVLSPNPVTLYSEAVSQHGSIEGYTPKSSIKATERGTERNEEEDIMETI